MKNVNKAILIALGMALPVCVMASPDEVTIRVMEMDEHAADAVTTHIELPEMAADEAKEHAAKGLETANKNREDEHKDADHDADHDDGEDRDHAMDREDDHEREMDREEEHEREIDVDREDRKDVEHEGRDREEVEHDGPDLGHDGASSRPDFEAPVQDAERSSHDSK